MEHWKRHFLLRVPRTPQSDSFPAALFCALRKKNFQGSCVITLLAPVPQGVP
jgi:hypothetical protein